MINPASWLFKRWQATSRDERTAPYKRGVTGSNPVAPTRFMQVEGLRASRVKGPRVRQEPNGHHRGVAESRPRRGHGEDSIYYDQASHNWVAAVSLGHKGGKRVRRKVTGRTKTEVRTKLRDLRRDLDSGVRPSATYTVGDALDDWLANGLGGTSARTKELYRDTEAFPSCLRFAGLQYVDGLGELPGAPGAAAELTQDAPGLELGVRALAGCAEPGAGAVCFLLRFRLVLAAVRDLGVRAALVALMGQGDQAGGLELGQHAPGPLGVFIVHRAGERPGHPTECPRPGWR